MMSSPSSGSGASGAVASGSKQVRPVKLFLGGLTRHTTTKQLRDHFSQYAKVLDCVAMRQPDGRPRGFGYVTLDSASAAERCLSEPQIIDGRVIDMKRAVPGSNSPSTTPTNASCSGAGHSFHNGPPSGARMFHGGSPSALPQAASPFGARHWPESSPFGSAAAAAYLGASSPAAASAAAAAAFAASSTPQHAAAAAAAAAWATWANAAAAAAVAATPTPKASARAALSPSTAALDCLELLRGPSSPSSASSPAAALAAAAAAAAAASTPAGTFGAGLFAGAGPFGSSASANGGVCESLGLLEVAAATPLPSSSAAGAGAASLHGLPGRFEAEETPQKIDLLAAFQAKRRSERPVLGDITHLVCDLGGSPVKAPLPSSYAALGAAPAMSSGKENIPPGLVLPPPAATPTQKQQPGHRLRQLMRSPMEDLREFAAPPGLSPPPGLCRRPGATDIVADFSASTGIDEEALLRLPARSLADCGF